MPKYMPTEIEELEYNRQSMLLSLTGQFTVVLFRFLTGHWSAGAIGLVVFIVGNKARCSLHNATLTSFVVLGLGAGALDSMELLHSLVEHGTGFFAFPLEANLFQDLSSIALTLAPVAEVSGARVAWDSFLQPELLLRSHRGAMQVHPGYMPQAGPWDCYGQQAMAQFPMEGGWQWQGPPRWQQGAPQKPGPYGRHSGSASSGAAVQTQSWGAAAYRYVFGGEEVATELDDFDDASSMSSSIYSTTRRRPVMRRPNARSTGGDSGLGPLSSTEPANDVFSDMENSEQCTQCGQDIPPRDVPGLRGTGAYAGMIYCSACWRNWS